MNASSRRPRATSKHSSRAVCLTKWLNGAERPADRQTDRAVICSGGAQFPAASRGLAVPPRLCTACKTLLSGQAGAARRPQLHRPIVPSSQVLVLQPPFVSKLWRCFYEPGSVAARRNRDGSVLSRPGYGLSYSSSTKLSLSGQAGAVTSSLTELS